MMKALSVFLAALCLSAVAAYDEPQFKLSYKLYFSNNETYIVINLLKYSNIAYAWGLQSPMEITWNNYSHINSTNRQAAIYTNESIEQFLVPALQKIQLRSLIQNHTKKPDLVVLALNRYQQKYFTMSP